MSEPLKFRRLRRFQRRLPRSTLWLLGLLVIVIAIILYLQSFE